MSTLSTPLRPCRHRMAPEAAARFVGAALSLYNRLACEPL